MDMAKIACALHELNAYKELGSIDCLRKLAQADREGRCVVLPAKLDQTICPNRCTGDFSIAWNRTLTDEELEIIQRIVDDHERRWSE